MDVCMVCLSSGCACRICKGVINLCGDDAEGCGYINDKLKDLICSRKFATTLDFFEDEFALDFGLEMTTA